MEVSDVIVKKSQPWMLRYNSIMIMSSSEWGTEILGIF